MISEAELAFLRARLDEDEAAAKAAPGSRWQAFAEDDIAGASVYDEQWLLLSPAHYDHDSPLSARPGATGPQYIERSRDALAAHIARHDPGRVLREVGTWRRIMAEYQLDGLDATYKGTERETGFRIALSAALRAKAAEWREHPDYDAPARQSASEKGMTKAPARDPAG